MSPETLEELKTNNPNIAAKTLHRMVAEHKDVTKIIIQLNAIVSIIKPDILELLAGFQVYDELWKTDAPTKVKEFMEGEPLTSEFDGQLRYYSVRNYICWLCRMCCSLHCYRKAILHV